MTPVRTAKLYKENTTSQDQVLADYLNDLLKRFMEAKDKKIRVKSERFNGRKTVVVSIWPIRILVELDKEWNKFVSIIGAGILRVDGFERAIKQEYPVIYGYCLGVELHHGKIFGR